MRPHKPRSSENRAAMRKRLKAEERRSQLLSIAKELFAEFGFENTYTKAIAAAAGVSEAIIFRHFSSKEDLYKSILDRKADEIGIKAWGEELRHFAQSENDEALVYSVVRHILEADRKDPQFQKLLLQAALSGRPLHKITGQRLLPLHRLLCDYIKKRQKKGAFRKCDPNLAAYAILSMPGYYGLAKILFGVNTVTLPEDPMALGFTQLILEGMHAPGSFPRGRKISKLKTNRRKT